MSDDEERKAKETREVMDRWFAAYESEAGTMTYRNAFEAGWHAGRVFSWWASMFDDPRSVAMNALSWREKTKERLGEREP